jgi:hypothetical protein
MTWRYSCDQTHISATNLVINTFIIVNGDNGMTITIKDAETFPIGNEVAYDICDFLNRRDDPAVAQTVINNSVGDTDSQLRDIRLDNLNKRVSRLEELAADYEIANNILSKSVSANVTKVALAHRTLDQIEKILRDNRERTFKAFESRDDF